MGLSIGFRNSIDKSLSVGLAIGVIVFVCENLALSGNDRLIRKRPTNVWADLEEIIGTTLLTSGTTFHSIFSVPEQKKGLFVFDTQARWQSGYQYRQKILTTRKLLMALRE